MFIPDDGDAFIASRDQQLDLLNAAFASGDRTEIGHAIGVVARATGGIGTLSRNSGVSLETIYGIIRTSKNPTLGTLLRIFAALQFDIQVVSTQS